MKPENLQSKRELECYIAGMEDMKESIERQIKLYKNYLKRFEFYRGQK